jgi:hypothetical protein
LLIALNGFHYSAPERRLTFRPAMRSAQFRSFWTVPCGWGTFSQTVSETTQQAAIETSEGSLAVASLVLQGGAKPVASISATLGGEAAQATCRTEGEARVVRFERDLRITSDQPLTVSLRTKSR